MWVQPFGLAIIHPQCHTLPSPGGQSRHTICVNGIVSSSKGDGFLRHEPDPSPYSTLIEGRPIEIFHVLLVLGCRPFFPSNSGNTCYPTSSRLNDTTGRCVNGGGNKLTRHSLKAIDFLHCRHTPFKPCS